MENKDTQNLQYLKEIAEDYKKLYNRQFGTLKSIERALHHHIGGFVQDNNGFALVYQGEYVLELSYGATNIYKRVIIEEEVEEVEEDLVGKEVKIIGGEYRGHIVQVADVKEEETGDLYYIIFSDSKIKSFYIERKYLQII